MNQLQDRIQHWSRLHGIFMLLSIVISYPLGSAWPVLVAVPFGIIMLFVSNRAEWRPGGFPGSRANAVTLVRLVLCLILLILARRLDGLVLAGLGVLIAALDGVDGYLARKDKKAGVFGAYLDMETDAVFVTCLSIGLYLKGITGPWILLAGAWRYIFVISLIWINPKNQPEGRLWLARVIAVFTMLGLSAAFALPGSLAIPIAGLVVIALSFSFSLSYRDMMKANGWKFKLKKSSPALPWIFWSLLFILQFALFGISYLGNWEDASFIPVWRAEDIKGFIALFYRINLDPFRLVFDVFLITLISIGFFRLTKKFWFSNLFFQISYGFLFLYTGYEAIIFRLFRSRPNFLSDVYIGIDVLPVFAQELQLGNVFSFSLLIIVVLAGIFTGFHLLRSFVFSAINMNWRKASKWILGAIMAYTIFGWIWVQSHRDMFSFYREDQLSHRFVAWDIAKNTHRSLQLLSRIDEFKQTDWSEYALPEGEMAVKPNIYLIFLESYGTVLLKDQELRSRFLPLIDSLSEELDPDWHVASTWSEAPIKGGRSWLSFTSVLSGLNIDDHFVYSHLLKSDYPIPMMAKFFNQQGYATYRLTSLGSNDDRIKIPYEQLSNFYRFKYWLLAEDLNYEGKFYGSVKAVPDQYALNKLHENYLYKEASPTFTFFITTASHWPWSEEQPPLLKNWSELNDIKGDGANKQVPGIGESKENYWLAMEYQIKMMFDFLNRYKHENTVLIFLGDHQPPFLADDRTSGTTMVHVFSKSPELLQSALIDGFEPGYGLKQPELIKEHKDLHDLVEWW